LDYIPENEEALGIFLSVTYEKLDSKEFLELISRFLLDFAGYEKKKDFTIIKKNLNELRYDDEELKPIFSSIKNVKIREQPKLYYKKGRHFPFISKEVLIVIFFVFLWIFSTFLLTYVETAYPEYQEVILIFRNFSAVGSVVSFLFALTLNLRKKS